MIHDFPGGLVVKNQLANARNIRDVGSLHGSGRSPGGGHGTPVCWPGKSTGREVWWATDHRVTESGTWLKQLSMHAFMIQPTDSLYGKSTLQSEEELGVSPVPIYLIS